MVQCLNSTFNYIFVLFLLFLHLATLTLACLMRLQSPYRAKDWHVHSYVLYY